MNSRSLAFFDAQFQRQVAARDLELNVFERRALPHLRGRVLDLGCGLGNLSLAAALRGCEVFAIDGSPMAITHLREEARSRNLGVQAEQADLRTWSISDGYDAIVSIGLLMFFRCQRGRELLEEIEEHVVPGGIAVVNVLVEGTTFLDMFEPEEHCLFASGAIEEHFLGHGWKILSALREERFDAPHGTQKVFDTVIASKEGRERLVAR